MRLIAMTVFTAGFFLLCYVSVDEKLTTLSQADAPVMMAGEMTDRGYLPNGVIPLYTKRGPEVYVGPMLTGETLTNFVREREVARVIRLNLERSALAELDTTAERRLIGRAYAATLHCYNVDAAPSGELNEAALSAIADLIATSPGPVYVHCQHGVHRAKMIGGLYYAAEGYRPATIYDLLGWWSVVRNRTYEKYVARVRVAAESSQINPTK